MSDAWRDQAKCRGMGTAIFFPGAGQPHTEAQRVCDECPVRDECLETGLSFDSRGIWGGQSERALRRTRMRSGR